MVKPNQSGREIRIQKNLEIGDNRGNNRGIGSNQGSRGNRESIIGGNLVVEAERKYLTEPL